MRRAIAMIAVIVSACGPRPGTGTGPGTGQNPETKPAKPAESAESVKSGWEAAGIDWSAPPAPGPEPVFAPPVPETFTLANGLQVVLVENHRLPLVSVRMVNARAGAREDGKQPGLASLTADLLDEGAGALGAIALSEEVEALGAQLDAAVSEDATVLWLDTLASTLDGSLGLLADLVQRPALAAADFERVKADVLEELRLRPQEPRKVAALVFDRVALGAHPYGQPPSGFTRTVKKLTRADVKRFWKDHYRPDHATLVIAGDVDRATLEPLLTRHFGDWKGKPLAAARPPAAPAAPAPALVVIDRPGAPQSVVMIGRVGPASLDPGFFAAELINTAVGDSFASRLNRRLREELGYTYGAYAAYWRGAWTGTWAFSSSLRTNVTVKGIQEALRILEEARAADLPDGELAKTRRLMLGQLPQAFETNAGIAGELAGLVADGRPLDWYQGYAAGVLAATGAEARAAAGEHWSGLSIVVVGDWKVIGDELAGLGLPIEHRDADGERARAP